MVGHRWGADKRACGINLSASGRTPAGASDRIERGSVSEEESRPGGRSGFWSRLKTSLTKTRGQLAAGVGNLLLGQKEIDDSVMEELETALLVTDVGIETTQHIMAELAERVKRQELNNTVALHAALGGLLKDLLQPLSRPFEIPPGQRPFVIFFVGVNGVGKTTTIGKLAKLLSEQGHSVMLAAGDTFRAAAVEQLKTWGERAGVPVIAQGQGADSASVVFDAVQAAGARGVDVLLADTAGRLQAKTNLMEELRKVKRVVNRLDQLAPHQVLLVLDAGIGQNAIAQVREFDAAVGVTGLVITKLDGTAKAGVLFAIARQVAKPVYFVGIGEGVDDLKPFSAGDFVDALLARD
jgi:fused signal recognition particle receptor